MRRALLWTVVFVAIFAVALPPAFADQCTATKNCSGGAAAQCQGMSTCQVLSNGVQCDGVTTSCPSGGCSVEYYCPMPPFSYPFILSCSGSSSCSTNSSSHSITCDGTTFTCSYCELRPNECDQAW
jgi:hypothetical protein